MALLLQDRLLPGVAELVPELEEIRHDIHAHPELGFETERTVGLICDYHRKSLSLIHISEPTRRS